MATNTTNYNLVKPGENDFYNVADANGNMDLLDSILFNLNKDKVGKVAGKGLSKNDFTNILKDKLDAIEEGANKYSHPLKHEPEIIEQDLNNRFISDFELAEIENTKLDLDEHKVNYVNFKNNIEAIRYIDEKIELKINGEWVEFKSGSQHPVGNVSDLNAKGDDKIVTLTWVDPPDTTVDDSMGNPVPIAKWKGTKVLRKTGSYPANENDGVLVVDNGIRNQYKTNGFTDTGLVNDTEYFYMAFPYTEDDVFTVDEANRVSGTPSDVDDKIDSPGPKKLIGGTMDAGYFGVVPASQLFTGTELAGLCGITEGPTQFNDIGWLKFAIDGKIIFKSQKTYRHSISWDHIHSKGCVFGTKEVEKNGSTFKVRLMKGLDRLASEIGAVTGDVCHNSEWNRLMLPIHVKAKGQSWAYPDNVDIPTEYYGVDFTDEDLHTINSAGDGSYQWCQENGTSATYRVYRGYDGVSYSNNIASSNTNAYRGWSPVLEVIS